MNKELSWLEFLDESDDADEIADEEEHRARHHHPRKSKGECKCEAHDMGVCPECGHLLWVHSKNGGCFYRMTHETGKTMDEAGDCPCKVARPPSPQENNF